MAAAIRTAIRQRSIATSLELRHDRRVSVAQNNGWRSRSQLHLYALAFERNAFWSSILAGELQRKFSNRARPLLHSRIGFSSEPARCIVPTEENPNCLGIRAVAIAETLAVVVVEGKCAVCSGMNAKCGRFGDLLGCELTHGIEGHNRAGAGVKRHRRKIDLTVDPFSA